MSRSLAGLVYDPSDQAMIFKVEQGLREHVHVVLSEAYGEGWLEQRVPSARLKVWRTRRECASRNGECHTDLLAFADFPDLKDIIVSKQNWREHFADMFGSKVRFIRAMEEVYFIRKALAHSRYITTVQRHSLRFFGASLLRTSSSRDALTSKRHTLLFSVKSVK